MYIRRDPNAHDPGNRPGQPFRRDSSPGTNASGDVNNPLVPHDSGIYLYTKNREGGRLDVQ